MKKFTFIFLQLLIVFFLLGCTDKPKDKIPPLIDGTEDIIHHFGDASPNYLDGVTAFDEIDGDLSSSIIVDTSNVNLELLGEYDVIYSVLDQAKNESKITVKIIVIDIETPTITGLSNMIYFVGDDLPDFLSNVSANDNYDGDITNQMIVDVDMFDQDHIGTYKIYYTITDTSSNQLVLSRDIEVKDHFLPEIYNTSDFYLEVFDEEPSYLDGITAYDAVDGDLTSFITVNSIEVNMQLPGIYPVVYSVRDLANNDLDITVYVHVRDFDSPVFQSVKPIHYQIGSQLPNLKEGLVIIDNVDGEITDQVEIDDQDVNYDQAGIYEFTYTIIDSSNNLNTYTNSILVTNEEQQDIISELNIYYINDYHGAIKEVEDEMGLANIGNLVLNEKTLNPDETLFIGGGDLLLGSLLSDYFYGASTLDILNEMKMDAFTIGNHDFDWGVEIMTNYRNPESSQLNVDFPLLGANIFYKDTFIRPDFIDPYTIIQKGHLKVGIIGLMGYGLEGLIDVNLISNYAFGDPLYWASYYTEYLRMEEDVDIVLVVLHDDGNQTGFNQEVSTWTNNQRVDAVFNGHSHETFATTIERDGINMPIIQSKSRGRLLGKVTFAFDEEGNMIDASAINLSKDLDLRLQTPLFLIEQIISFYETQIETELNEIIITSREELSRADLAFYMAKLLRLSTDSDVGFFDLSGINSHVSQGEDITVRKLYEIIPYYNQIRIVYLSGAQVRAYIQAYNGYYSKSTDIKVFNDQLYYRVAVDGYLFELPDDPSLPPVDPIETGLIIRDVFESVLIYQKNLGLLFTRDNPIIYED